MMDCIDLLALVIYISSALFVYQGTNNLHYKNVGFDTIIQMKGDK
jgi:hypothetical protein